MERLQKIIANRGYTSRRHAEELITNGKVKVNGVTVKELGCKFDDDVKIEIEGKIIKNEAKVYYILNKPRGVISTSSDDKNRKTVVEFINTNYRIYPIGRLDYDTTGLIILTNDGNLSNLITHPKNNIDKVYVAKIEGILSVEEINKLKKGIKIDNYLTSPARVKLKSKNTDNNTSIVELTIHEGKNHQVKKMLDAVNHKVLKLKREKIGFLNLNGLKSGEYRKLKEFEVKELYNLAKKNKM